MKGYMVLAAALALFAGCSNTESLLVSTFCDNGNRVYKYTGYGVAVVPADPTCREAR